MPRPKGSKNKPKAAVVEEAIEKPQTTTSPSPGTYVPEDKHKKWARLIEENNTVIDDADRLKIPPEIIPDGMSYQWITHSIIGEVQAQRRGRYSMNGWEPVPAMRHDGMFMPMGYQGEIEIDGLVLMERPAILTERARKADLIRARSVVQAKEAQLRGGDVGVTLDSQHPNALRQNKINKSYERIVIPEN